MAFFLGLQPMMVGSEGTIKILTFLLDNGFVLRSDHKYLIQQYTGLRVTSLALYNKQYTPSQFYFGVCGTCGSINCSMLCIARVYVHQREMSSSNTPLHCSAKVGNLQLAYAFLQARADTNTKNKFGESALHLGAVNGYADVVAILLNAGASVNILDDDKQTPLHYSAFKGHASVVEILLEYGANVNAADKYLRTPLHLGVSFKHSDIVEILIKERANLNAVDEKKETPLHKGVRAGHKEIVQILLQKGADVDVKDKNNKTPLDLSMSFKHEHISNLLILAKIFDVENYSHRNDQGATSKISSVPQTSGYLDGYPNDYSRADLLDLLEVLYIVGYGAPQQKTYKGYNGLPGQASYNGYAGVSQQDILYRYLQAQKEEEILEASYLAGYEQGLYNVLLEALIQSSYKEPTGAQSTYKEPSGAQPTNKEPSSAQPTYREPFSAQPTYKEPSGAQSTYSETSDQGLINTLFELLKESDYDESINAQRLYSEVCNAQPEKPSYPSSAPSEKTSEKLYDAPSQPLSNAPQGLPPKTASNASVSKPSKTPPDLPRKPFSTTSQDSPSETLSNATRDAPSKTLSNTSLATPSTIANMTAPATPSKTSNISTPSTLSKTADMCIPAKSPKKQTPAKPSKKQVDDLDRRMAELRITKTSSPSRARPGNDDNAGQQLVASEQNVIAESAGSVHKLRQHWEAACSADGACGGTMIVQQFFVSQIDNSRTTVKKVGKMKTMGDVKKIDEVKKMQSSTSEVNINHVVNNNVDNKFYYDVNGSSDADDGDDDDNDGEDDNGDGNNSNEEDDNDISKEEQQ